MEKHHAVLHLIPSAPCDVLDIGAGTGADAAWLAGLSHRVVAVEPTDELRGRGTALHPSDLIEWVSDGLPHLVMTRKRGQAFDLGMMIRRGGVLIMSLRHGPCPLERRV